MSSSRPLLTARARAGAGLLVAGLLALTACGRDDAEPVPAPAMATATEALPSMDMTPFTLDVPSLDLDKVPGASLAVLEGEDPEYHAAWLSVPGAPAWTSAMDRAVRDHVAAYERDTDRAADPVLGVQPRLAVAGPDAAATRLLATERRGDRSVSTVQTVWYSAREDRVASTRDLFTDRGWEAFRKEVRDRMTTDPAIVQDRLTSAVEQPDQVENARIWDALVFLPDGSALLEVDQAAMAPADAGVLTARIPADTVRPWLAEIGLAAQDAARTPGTLRLPERAAPASSAGTPGSTPDGVAPAPGTVPGTPGGPAGSDTPGSPTGPGSSSASGPASDSSAPSATGGTDTSAPAAPPAPSSSAGSPGGSSGAPGGSTRPAPAPAPSGVSPIPVPVPAPSSGPVQDPTPTVPGRPPSPAPTSSAPTTAPAPAPSPEPTPTTSQEPAPTTAPVPMPEPGEPSTPAPPPSDAAPTAPAEPTATTTTSRSEARSGTQGRPTDPPVGGPAAERRASPKATEPTAAPEAETSASSAAAEETAGTLG